MAVMLGLLLISRLCLSQSSPSFDDMEGARYLETQVTDSLMSCEWDLYSRQATPSRWSARRRQTGREQSDLPLILTTCCASWTWASGAGSLPYWARGAPRWCIPPGSGRTSPGLAREDIPASPSQSPGPKLNPEPRCPTWETWSTQRQSETREILFLVQTNGPTLGIQGKKPAGSGETKAKMKTNLRNNSVQISRWGQRGSWILNVQKGRGSAH